MPTYTTKQFIDAMPGTGGVVSHVADIVGCSWHTAKKLITEHATVTKAWENERNKITDRARHNIIKSIEGGDLMISKWWLQVMDDEFAERRTLRHEGTGEGGAIVIEERYTDEERIRGLGALFDAVRTGVLAGDYGGDDALDADERSAMAGVSESGG